MPENKFSSRVKFELISWSSLAMVLALLEGGVMGVLIKNGFDGKVEDWLLNLAVAAVTGAPYFSNLLSFFWVKLSHGHAKATFVSNLAMFCCLCAFGMSFISFDAFGLVVLLLLYIIARITWSGILTIRSTIWRVNYPRYVRAKVTAKLATFASLLMSITAIATGWILDWKFAAFQWIYSGFALISLYGAYRYRHLSVRHQVKNIAAEQSKRHDMSFGQMLSLLKQNKPFGRYMLAMFVLGSGNLMFMAPLIVFMNEHTSLAKTSQILITTAIPLAIIPFAVGSWAKLLDGNHIFHFRAIHSWGFVLALMAFCTATISGIEALFFVGAVFYGVAISGGVIGWNLGHNDFVGKASPMEYMAVHVTLTGIRGLIAPMLGVAFYQWLASVEESTSTVNNLSHSQTDLTHWALILPLSVTTLGGILFVWFNYLRLKSAS